MNSASTFRQSVTNVLVPTGIASRVHAIFARAKWRVLLLIASVLLASAHGARAYDFPPAVKWDSTVIQYSWSGSDANGSFQEYDRDETYYDEENNPQGGHWWVRIYEGAPGFVQFGSVFAGTPGPSGSGYYDFAEGDFMYLTEYITLEAVNTDGSPWEP